MKRHVEITIMMMTQMEIDAQKAAHAGVILHVLHGPVARLHRQHEQVDHRLPETAATTGELFTTVPSSSATPAAH